MKLNEKLVTVVITEIGGQALSFMCNDEGVTNRPFRYNFENFKEIFVQMNSKLQTSRQ